MKTKKQELMMKKHNENFKKGNSDISLLKEKRCDTSQIRKGQSGITLIALVITVIVLLILAGVSINMLSRR